MCFHIRHLYIAAALLCSGPAAIAGSVQYEALDGTQCRVIANQPAQLEISLDVNQEQNDGWGYDNFYGSNNNGFGGSIGLTVPLGDTTRGAVQQCNEMALQDQQRNHFDWLYERYLDGVITRSALQKLSNKLGVELTTEEVDSADTGFQLTVN